MTNWKIEGIVYEMLAVELHYNIFQEYSIHGIGPHLLILILPQPVKAHTVWFGVLLARVEEDNDRDQDDQAHQDAYHNASDSTGRQTIATTRNVGVACMCSKTIQTENDVMHKRARRLTAENQPATSCVKVLQILLAALRPCDQVLIVMLQHF